MYIINANDGIKFNHEHTNILYIAKILLKLQQSKIYLFIILYNKRAPNESVLLLKTQKTNKLVENKYQLENMLKIITKL